MLGERYTEFEDVLDEQSPSETRQLWHTPTELFRPYYGEAMARYLVTNYKLLHHPYHDLIIYEMGAGNGTLMLNILDYIRDVHPDVYERTKFKIIEISPALATLQTAQLARTALSRGHIEHVEIINRSIFNWDSYVSAPCYFLSLEVFDNFAHDSIRYDHFTEQPLQGSVLIDSAGEFYEFYTKDIDPVASRFLRVRHTACTHPFKHPLSAPRLLRNIRARLPFATNLTVPEYIPTRLMQFFDILREYFPFHQLLASDFHSLPDAVKGMNAPVVQTRYQRRTVPVKTPLVSISFPRAPSSLLWCPYSTVAWLKSRLGSTRVFRYFISHKFRCYRGYIPSHDRSAHAGLQPRRLLAPLERRRGDSNPQRRKPDAELVQERKRPGDSITSPRLEC